MANSRASGHMELNLDFVSKLIGKKVNSFTLKPGNAQGFTSVMYSLECILESEGETVFAISKCYPNHPSRQQYLKDTNVFWNELQLYKHFVPTLKTFQGQMGVNDNLPFTPLISGEAIDFGNGKVNKETLMKYSDKIFDPFDNYIMMVDMKRTYGFRVANRIAGLDLEEISLVMAEYAKLHALSWAYKLKSSVNEFSETFPYMQVSRDTTELWMSVMGTSCQTAYDTLKTVKDVNPGILKGILGFEKIAREVIKNTFDDKESGSTPIPLEKLLRVKMERKSDEEPWRVVIHGDCQINNLLFRYDPDTKKAVELVLIDLQQMREACPTLDLAYVFYTNTTFEFRQNHLDDMLKFYHSKFMSYCDQLDVEYLPGFSLENLKRRFHASKLFGLMLALLALPVVLTDEKIAENFENFNADEDLSDMFDMIAESNKDNTVLRGRIFGVAKEFYSEGVI